MEIGAFEAKTKLSEYLARVARGEEFTITRHGKAIAHLIPAHAAVAPDRRAAIEGLKAMSQGRAGNGTAVGAADLRDWVEHGRRF